VRNRQRMGAALFLLAVIAGSCRPGPETSSAETESNNVCLHYFASDIDPAKWREACLHANPLTPNIVFCLDANPSGGIDEPVLEDGIDPDAVWVIFQNQDGEETSLGPVIGCSGEVAGTCRCCPDPTDNILCSSGPAYSVPPGGVCDFHHPACCRSGVCDDKGNTLDGPYACQARKRNKRGSISSRAQPALNGKRPPSSVSTGLSCTRAIAGDTAAKGAIPVARLPPVERRARSFT